MTEPTKPTTPLATGGMSPEGTTTVVKIAQPKVPLTDRLVLCPAICKCKDAPGKGADGRSLKQSCVSGALKGVDKAMDHKSPYKPEVNYDMTRTPPAPIMDSEVPTKGHDWLPGWITKWWDTPDEQGGQRPAFKAGKGFVRRPDVVIVNDPSRPPTQDNIKQVVEIKFPPDELSKSQKDAYVSIAGGEDRFAKLEPDDCDCDLPEPRRTRVPAPDPKSLSAAAMALALLLGILAF
jgi:hypothetical protein